MASKQQGKMYLIHNERDTSCKFYAHTDIRQNFQMRIKKKIQKIQLNNLLHISTAFAY